jgi:biotin operon repressor
MRKEDSAVPPTGFTSPADSKKVRLLNSFTQVPNTVLFHPGMSCGARLTWMALMAYQWKETQAPYPSQQTLAALLGVSRQCISTHVRELKDHGLVNVRKGGSRRTPEYDLHAPTAYDWFLLRQKQYKRVMSCKEALSSPDNRNLQRQ